MSHWLTWVYLKLGTAHCPLVAAHYKGLCLSFFSASGLVLVVRMLTGLHTGTTKNHTAEATLNQWGVESGHKWFSLSFPIKLILRHVHPLSQRFQWQQAPIAFSRNLIIAMHFIVYVTSPNSSVIFLQVSFQSNSWNLSYCLGIYCKERSGGAQTGNCYYLHSISDANSAM